jgi:hypothetical protein
MSRFDVTPAAAARLREMMARDEHGRDVIIVYAERSQPNNRRGVGGVEEWSLERGRLLFDLAAEAQLAGRRIDQVGDLKFFVVEKAQTMAIDGLTIDYTADGYTLG